MSEGIQQARPAPYLSVNVYRGSGRWHVVAMLREPGKPYPRLLRTLFVSDLPGNVPDLPSALEAASQRLLEAAREISQAHAR